MVPLEKTETVAFMCSSAQFLSVAPPEKQQLPSSFGALFLKLHPLIPPLGARGVLGYSLAFYYTVVRFM